MPGRNYRLFVGNLPNGTTQNEVVKKFQKYGSVESVEIKSKKDFSGEVASTFCFVNLNTDDSNLRKGVQHLNGFRWDGQVLKVEVAKESFLQRLQRERQNNPPASTDHHQPPQPSPPKISAPSTKIASKKWPVKSQESSSSESSDSDEEDDKRHPTSKLSMFKGLGSIAADEPSTVTQSVYLKSKDTKSDFKNSSFKKSNKSYPDDSNDILKKFESFSSVWKDDGESSDELNPPRSRFSGKQPPSFRELFESGSKTSDARIDEELPTPPRSKAAEEKRLKSIDERRLKFEQQKKAIQSALSVKQTGPQLNKKIMFNDDDDNDNFKVSSKSRANSKGNQSDVGIKKQNNERKGLSLFDDSDNEEDDDASHTFQVKKQFEGRKGKKLLDLQGRFNNDQRFKLDERFYESDEETGSRKPAKVESKTHEADDGTEGIEGVEGLAEEREQQLQILSSILGQAMPLAQVQSSESKVKSMLRFDPSKPSHLRYELSKEVKKKVKKLKPKDGKVEVEEVEEDDEEEEMENDAIKKKVRREEKPPEPVSQDRFFAISDNLTETLKHAKEGETSGFSLLQMFGSANDTAGNRGKQETYLGVEEKIKPSLKRPFLQEDSSSGDEDDEMETEGPTAAVDTRNSSSNGVISTGGVWQENFFFQPDDKRFKEGESFMVEFDKSVDREKFSELRKELKLAAKNRRNKSRKSANSFKTKVGQFKKKPMWGSSSNRTAKRPKKWQKH